MEKIVKKTARHRKNIIMVVLFAMLLGLLTPWLDWQKAGPIPIKLIINAAEVQTSEEIGKPYIAEERTMVPIRLVSENLGYEVAWDNEARMVTVQSGEKAIRLWIGKSQAEINGAKAAIDPANSQVVPLIKDDRTYVPLRFVGEALGATVNYRLENDKLHVITIDTSGKSQGSSGNLQEGLLPHQKPNPGPIGQKREWTAKDIEAVPDEVGRWTFFRKGLERNPYARREPIPANGWIEPKIKIAYLDCFTHDQNPIALVVENAEEFAGKSAGKGAGVEIFYRNKEVQPGVIQLQNYNSEDGTWGKWMTSDIAHRQNPSLRAKFTGIWNYYNENSMLTDEINVGTRTRTKGHDKIIEPEIFSPIMADVIVTQGDMEKFYYLEFPYMKIMSDQTLEAGVSGGTLTQEQADAFKKEAAALGFYESGYDPLIIKDAIWVPEF